MDFSDTGNIDRTSSKVMPPGKDLFDGPACSRRSLFCWITLTGSLLSLVGLYGLSRHNYLLFHSLVEIFSVVVALTIFSLGWHAQKIHRNNALLLFSVAFLVVGCLDFVHTISYEGMGVFPGHDANLPTQLWLCARLIESLSYLGAASVLGYRLELNGRLLLSFYLMFGAGLLLMIHPFDLFPVCYVAGKGLTPFKVISEYVITALMGLAAIAFWIRRNRLNKKIFYLLLASIVLSIFSELSFTLYVDVYGYSNATGHIFKLGSMILVYLALVQSSLRTPYKTLFRDLVQSKDALDQELTEHCRTEEKLRASNRELDAFVHTVSHDLRQPLSPIISLSGFLHEKLQEHPDPQVLEAIGVIEHQGKRMYDVLEDLLVLARLGRLEDPEHPVEGDKVLDQVLIELGSEIAVRRIVVERAGLPQLRIPETLLYQLLLNLVSNAVRYAGDEDGTIVIGGERMTKRVQLFVCDHGEGIADEERENIFEVFYRGRAGAEIKGTGVGLATVQKIAHLYRGKAWVEETPGGGATFRVELRDV